MAIDFLNPLQLLVEVFEALTLGTKKALVRFETPDCDLFQRDSVHAKGVTIFPEDPERPPLVLIRSDLPIMGAIDILAHELSHVAIGPDKQEDHGQEWKDFYDELFQSYCSTVELKSLEFDTKLGVTSASEELEETLADEPVDAESENPAT